MTVDESVAPRTAIRARRGVQRWLAEQALRYGLIVVALVAWEVATRRMVSIFFPPPSQIAVAMYQLWLSDGPPRFLTDRVFVDIVPSLWRILQGWSIAVVGGIALGVIIGRSRLASDLTMPTVNFLRSTPGPALIPVFLILLGSGTTMRVALIAFSSLWPVLLNTIDGVRSVDRVKLDTARVFSLPRAAVLRRVVLPAAGPKIIAGVRIATAVSLVLMVISELVAATHGLGFHLAESQRFFRLTDMWAGIVLIGALGYTLNALLLAAERRLLAWHIGERKR